MWVCSEVISKYLCGQYFIPHFIICIHAFEKKNKEIKKLKNKLDHVLTQDASKWKRIRDGVKFQPIRKLDSTPINTFYIGWYYLYITIY